jgi:VanZ family protein
LSIAATLGWMAVIMVFLGSSDPPGPGLRAWWFPILAHLFLFGVLGFLVSVSGLLAVRSSRLPTNMALVVLVGGGWGVFSELYQYTVPGRSAAAGDGLADVVGSVLGGVMAWAVMLWISRNLAGIPQDPIHSQ